MTKPTFTSNQKRETFLRAMRQLMRVALDNGDLKLVRWIERTEKALLQT
jgi:hypothetical protein